MSALAQVDGWPVGAAAVAVLGPAGEIVDARGDRQRGFEWASLTKVVTAMACWVAVEEGTLAWDTPAGPAGSTVAHLLAHASGLAPDADTELASPGARRLYSNRGFEVVAETLAVAAGMPADDYVRDGVLGPLGMVGASPVAGPTGMGGSLDDLVRLAGALVVPTLVSAATHRRATSVAFPGLDGILPGFGRQSPNDWGLGVEIRGTKSPHWTAAESSPRTFGHFGQQGGFVWIDPDAGLACCCLTDRPFGRWAIDAWPALASAVLATHAGS